jgi:hypothetical protein
LGEFSAERLSAGTAGAGVSVETGFRVKVTESMADRAAPAVDQPRLVLPSVCCVFLHVEHGAYLACFSERSSSLMDMTQSEFSRLMRVSTRSMKSLSGSSLPL